MDKKEKETGRIKTYDALKGYGFIERDRGKNVFVSYKAFEPGDDDGAIVGAIVAFRVEEAGKGPRAREVEIIG